MAAETAMLEDSVTGKTTIATSRRWAVVVSAAIGVARNLTRRCLVDSLLGITTKMLVATAMVEGEIGG